VRWLDSGNIDSIIANNNTAGNSTVTIKKSDGAFETSGCTPWTKHGKSAKSLSMVRMDEYD
jgi:hypothetical protein